MNWEGVAESSQNKIESLVNAFDKFIETHHKGSSAPQDRRINT
jgi:hypothetical protein